MAGSKSEGPSIDLPKELRDWLDDNELQELEWTVCKTLFDANADESEKYRYFLLTSVPLEKLEFKNHYFNPRTPNVNAVKDLSSSIAQLALLSPLTCVFLEEHERPPSDKKDIDNDDKVYLIDGRHRFNALKSLQRSNPSSEYSKGLRVDLKIFFHLKKSEVLLMANYLNRSRRQLKPGEYYNSVVSIYDETEKEIIRSNDAGYTPTEKEVFEMIPNEKLKNRNLDLSIGRIVGTVAFDDEDKDSWYGYVGIDQGERIKSSENPMVDGCYRPLTAGVLFHLLKPLCYPSYYTDNGTNRAIEIKNSIELGRHYREHIMKNPARDKATSTATSISCKTYVSMAFGELLRNAIWHKFTDDEKEMYKQSVFSNPNLDWDFIDDVLDKFYQIVEPEAAKVNEYRRNNDLKSLNGVWSFQTQKAQVLSGLVPALRNIGVNVDPITTNETLEN